jgi:hypothetical protein
VKWYLFSANGALFTLAWGNAPGFQVAYRTSAESAIQRANESRLPALMLSIDGLPWARPKAEDGCCAFGAKQIRETPFPIGVRRGGRPTILFLAGIRDAAKEQTHAAGHVLDCVDEWTIDFHFDRRWR